MVSAGRVAILVENLSVPFDRRVWQEASTLVRAGYDVTVICPTGTTYDLDEHEVLDGVEILRYPLSFAGGGFRGYASEYAQALKRTHSLLKHASQRGPIEIVHACNPPDFLLLAALPLRRKGTRFIFDHHDLVPELYLSRFANAPKLGYYACLAFERLAFSLADVVVTTNESYRNVALARNRVSPDRIFVVRSAPDRSVFGRVPAKPELKRGKRFLIGYVGVMGPQDGVDHALHALALLRKGRSDWHAIFVGGGDCLDAMKDLCRELDLDDYIEFTGRVPNGQLLEVLSTADVCLAPDPKNPLNDVSTMNKVVEYLTLGVPVVSYDLRETRASADGAGVYAEGDTPAAFAAAMDRVLSDDVGRAKLRQIALERAEELTWERSEEQLLRAYERIRQARAAA